MTEKRCSVLYCIYYCFTCSFDVLHQLSKFSYVAFGKLSEYLQRKAQHILAYTYTSLWNSQKLRDMG